MDITFTIKITEEGIPQLIGLLAKMWNNPNPAANVTVEETPEGKVVTVNPEVPTTPAPVQAVPVETPAPAPVAAKPTAAQIQAAAGAFMDAAPGNITILQNVLRELGATALPQLKPDQLEAFAAKLREQGAIL